MAQQASQAEPVIKKADMRKKNNILLFSNEHLP